MKSRVLVVDDSPFIRRVLSDWISKSEEFELVGTANDGVEAVKKAADLKPDVITLDVEMPNLDGIGALKQIMETCPTKVLMVSSITTQGATSTLNALQLGAIDFFTKPQSSSSLAFMGAKDELMEKLRACVLAKTKHISVATVSQPALTISSNKVVCIASSTGGPRALNDLWKTLPKGFPCPILIVQHMPEGFTDSLAKRLNSIGTVPCKEAVNGESIKPGIAYIAPGGKHMIVKNDHTIGFLEEPSLHGVKPAADYLFESMAKVYGNKIVGLVLTGMGKDGAQGALTIKNSGGIVFGESEETCTIYGMPKMAKQAGAIAAEYPLHELGAVLTANLKERVRHAS